jgi:nicotinamide riboside transporter PnuC
MVVKVKLEISIHVIGGFSSVASMFLRSLKNLSRYLFALASVVLYLTTLSVPHVALLCM